MKITREQIPYYKDVESVFIVGRSIKDDFDHFELMTEPSLLKIKEPGFYKVQHFFFYYFDGKLYEKVTQQYVFDTLRQEYKMRQLSK